MRQSPVSETSVSETSVNEAFGPPSAQSEHHTALQGYYQFHSKIYDRTRWSFLFGRQAIIAQIGKYLAPQTILEVGCGTGKNLVALAKAFPAATITGVDISAEMLAIARRNLAAHQAQVQLINQPYDQPLNRSPTFDLVLFSYALTMFNPGWQAALEHAHADLVTGGSIAVVDFHNSGLPAFKRWMGVNHVRMDGHLLPYLETHFTPQAVAVQAAYGGFWQYLSFVGKKAA